MLFEYFSKSKITSKFAFVYFDLKESEMKTYDKILGLLFKH